MRILVFNWRDIKNPEKGGAEIYTHEIFKRLAKKGWEITLFTSKFKGCKKIETVDNIRTIRGGGKFSVYLKARSFYKKNKNEFDVVVDEINTIPFFTPKYVNTSKILCLIHQLAKEFWFYETFFPINWVGYWLEKKWVRYYANIATITVSNSTKSDLKKIGFKKVFIIHNGINTKPVEKLPEKTDYPTIIFVGRMKKAKKPQDVIKAFKIVKKEVKNAKLWMVGDGYLRKILEKNIRDKNVKFFGYLKKEVKDELVKKAWLIVVPGVREGWGQVVTDANALGTPAIGYNIPGLRDSIKNKYNGILVENNPKALAEAIIKLIEDEKLRKKLSKNAIKWAKQFSWDKSAEKFEKIVKSITNR